MARECAETKILRIPSRRAQRALVRVAPAARKLDLGEQRSDALCSLASRQEEREEDKGAEEKGRGREREREGEAAMNDRNQRNTAPRKLPGIHPEYIIHTGVPAGGGVHLWVERSPERAQRPEEEKRARDGSRRGRRFSRFALAETTPNYDDRIPPIR